MTDYSKITALYSRLSVGDEDRDGGESNSIQNQKIFLENYARGQHLTNIRHYIDDDESGRFFDRSAYSRMMDDVENGKIGVCIMKDLTRWGRDYLQVGNAMEIFRRNNVRFIAVNNGIDSEKPDTLEFAPFINIMSEWYAKDISKKVKTGIKTKGMSGKPIVTEAPYGYVKDPDNKDFWIIDEEAAEVVRLIFRLFIGGKNRNQIAVYLTQEQIPTPTFYMKDRGRGTCKNKTLNEDNRCKWNKATLTNMADVELTSVDWLWFPYIPFGKLTIIQGNPGEGKTYFAMRLAAACTNRKPLPGMETIEPFNIIYQTAEDGLGDTVKPRLMEADADLERVLVIDDRDTPLTLADERIARAIRENNARLVIIDPVQAFLGADVDMNRANEVRPIFRSLGDIAQATGCAIVLIGHLNKAAGTQSTYRGLGSIDITAAVRSLLFIGKLKDSPTTRVLIHEKSSLAPPGQSLAFSLGDEKGFEWIGAYDITADELLAGTDTAKTESKTAQAQMLILELLADGKRMPSAELEKAVNERGISSRTMRTAKSRIGDRLVTEKDGTAWVCYLRD